MAHKVTIGSISHGTLKTDDLLEAFGWELQHIDGVSDEHAKLANKAREIAHAYRFAERQDREDDCELVAELQDALTEYAPPYCYFGANEGDGSDFGFWPSMDAIEELPKFNDLADVPDDIEGDYIVVNDHGNVSVYGQDGSLIWDCV